MKEETTERSSKSVLSGPTEDWFKNTFSLTPVVIRLLLAGTYIHSLRQTLVVVGATTVLAERK